MSTGCIKKLVIQSQNEYGPSHRRKKDDGKANQRSSTWLGVAKSVSVTTA